MSDNYATSNTTVRITADTVETTNARITNNLKLTNFTSGSVLFMAQDDQVGESPTGLFFDRIKDRLAIG